MLRCGHSQSSTSGDELLAMFVYDDQGIHGADRACVDQPFPINIREVRLERTDIFPVELEDLRRDLHTIGRTNTQPAIDADPQAANFPFDDIADGHPSMLAAPGALGLTGPIRRRAVTASPLTRARVPASPPRKSWTDPREDRRRPRLSHLPRQERPSPSPVPHRAVSPRPDSWAR